MSWVFAFPWGEEGLSRGCQRACDLEGARVHASGVFEVLNTDVGVTLLLLLLSRSLTVLLQTQGTWSFWCDTAPRSRRPAG